MLAGHLQLLTTAPHSMFIVYVYAYNMTLYYISSSKMRGFPEGERPPQNWKTNDREIATPKMWCKAYFSRYLLYTVVYICYALLQTDYCVMFNNLITLYIYNYIIMYTYITANNIVGRGEERDARNTSWQFLPEQCVDLQQVFMSLVNFIAFLYTFRPSI